jgi:diguanylate cyclase (GGDEF)-like protein
MLASIDGLTGLANRMTYDARLAQEWRRAAETEGTLALLMIDVDHFKSFNDAYGHLDGDACLRAIAGVLSETAPAGALAARYGGEEFVVLLPGVAAPPAAEVADRIRRAVEKLYIRHAGASGGHVTVSIGAAETAPATDTQPSSLIELADDALYRAKKRGRNLVVSQLALPLPQAC